MYPKKIVIFQKKFNHSTKMCNHFSKNYNHFPKKCNHPSNKFNQSSNTPTLKRIAPSLLKMYTHKKNNPILLKNILNLQKEICLSKKCLLSNCAYFLSGAAGNSSEIPCTWKCCGLKIFVDFADIVESSTKWNSFQRFNPAKFESCQNRASFTTF